MTLRNVVIVPPECEMRHNCDPSQLHEIRLAATWALGMVVFAVVTAVVGVWVCNRYDRRH